MCRKPRQRKHELDTAAAATSAILSDASQACCCLQGGMTALIWASQNGHAEVVGKLIAAGAKLDQLKKVKESGVPCGLCCRTGLCVCMGSCVPPRLQQSHSCQEFGMLVLPNRFPTINSKRFSVPKSHIGPYSSTKSAISAFLGGWHTTDICVCVCECIYIYVCVL